MIRPSLLAFALASTVAACTASPPEGIVGPYSGPVHRFVIDRIELPHTATQAREVAGDLDGNGGPDNQFGLLVGMLASYDNANTHADDMLAAGVLSPSLELQADDLASDAAAGAWLYGADGEPAVPVGGAITAGAFASNRVATTRPTGTAVLHLPVFVDADPTVVELVGVELDLEPDGRGGYDGIVRGGIRAADAAAATLAGSAQLLAARPHEHRWYWYLVDTDHDGALTELDMQGGLMRALLEPDLVLALDDGDAAVVSVAFRVHLSPCAAGRCAAAPPADTCADRVLDGDETDLDCGGSCGTCPGGARCASGDDCQTGACDGGVCRAPTCADGMINGYEAAVDCGGTCGGCDAGQRCEFDEDCASNRCLPNGTCS